MTTGLILSAFLFTLWVTFASFLLASVLGLVVAAARRSKKYPIQLLATTWISIIRGVPPLVWLFIVYFGIATQDLRLSPANAAIITFGLVGSAYMGEAYRAGLESVSKNQREALDALSMPPVSALRLVIIPQALPITLSTGTTYLIHLLKDTALASLIGVQEITYLTRDAVERGTDGFIAFFILGLAYLIISAPIGLMARKIEERANSKRLAGAG